jgi:hydrogenase maturation protein HypF
MADNRQSSADRAYRFHNSIVEAIVQQARTLREERGEFAVGLCGGVFQNRLLSQLTTAALEAAGFRVYLPTQVPVNDAGLCYGQVVEAAARLNSQ